jgi:hypothetical protein
MPHNVKGKITLKEKLLFIFLIAFVFTGSLSSQGTTIKDYEFIFVLAPGCTTSLASNMKRDNWAFTEKGQNIDELYLLLNNSINSSYNRANYQKLADYVISSLLYMDLAGFFIYVLDIPIENALKPKVIDVEFSPTGRITQIDIKLKFGDYDATLSISKFPGLFIKELSEDFNVEYKETKDKVRLYFIGGKK